jgi:hypothetical protein
MSDQPKRGRGRPMAKVRPLYLDENGKKRSEYNIWNLMKCRCSCQTNKKYYMYGAKGVSVCQRWKDSFANFWEDMGPKPSPIHSIDRYPNKMGNYEPGNVRWATPKEQSNNTAQNVVYEVDGISKTVTEWAEQIDVHSGVIQKRIKKWGWTIREAVTTPPRKNSEQHFMPS